MPEPALVMLFPAPEIAPPTIKELPVNVTVGLPPKVTAPVPRFKDCVPVKVKLPFQVIVLLLERVKAPTELLLIVVPALIVKLPVPKAVALFIFKVPALKVVVPL